MNEIITQVILPLLAFGVAFLMVLNWMGWTNRRTK